MKSLFVLFLKHSDTETQSGKNLERKKSVRPFLLEQNNDNDDDSDDDENTDNYSNSYADRLSQTTW